jgi:hypothetical protein
MVSILQPRNILENANHPVRKRRCFDCASCETDSVAFLFVLVQKPEAMVVVRLWNSAIVARLEISAMGL